jgi:hypothetical protein
MSQNLVKDRMRVYRRCQAHRIKAVQCITCMWSESLGSAGKSLEAVVAAHESVPSPRRKPGSRTPKWNVLPKILDSGFRRNDVKTSRIRGRRLIQQHCPLWGLTPRPRALHVDLYYTVYMKPRAHRAPTHTAMSPAAMPFISGQATPVPPNMSTYFTGRVAPCPSFNSYAAHSKDHA